MAEKTVYHGKNRSSQSPKYVLLVLFFLLLLGFSSVNAVFPKRTKIELENRNAAAFPTVTAENLLNGEWFSDFADYMQDQVAFRDSLIDMKCAVDEIFLQCTDENGILIGKDHWLFTRLFAITDSTETQLEKNLTAVTEFASRYPDRVTFMLAPSASVIYEEELPLAAPMADENAKLDEIFSRVSQSAEVIDLRETFKSLKNEYLYYKTDHHWTTNGAYHAYQQFCSLKGLTPFDTAAHEAVEITGFEGTHYSSTRLWNVEPDTITYYPLTNPMTVYQLTGEAQFEAENTEKTVNTAKFETRDKYSAFLDGNNGYSVIEGNGTGSILVVKDSYANCFVPFLTENYAKIGVVDFRNFPYGLDTTIEKEGYDEILILYNFQTFIDDSKVIYINRPTTIS